VKEQREAEFIMRVKLPSSSGYASSGDTDYDQDYSAAILGALPVGFEVAWKTRGTWPMDRDGLTWVKIYCTDKANALSAWMNDALESRRELNRIRETIKAL
jgi:hypothetical protein